MQHQDVTAFIFLKSKKFTKPIPNPPCSRVLVGYQLTTSFGHMKNMPVGEKCSSDTEVQAAVCEWIKKEESTCCWAQCYLHHVTVSTLADSVHRSTNVVNDAHNSRRVFALNQLADDLVVEIVDRRPLDSFPHVLFLHNNNNQS